MYMYILYVIYIIYVYVYIIYVYVYIYKQYIYKSEFFFHNGLLIVKLHHLCRWYKINF